MHTQKAAIDLKPSISLVFLNVKLM